MKPTLAAILMMVGLGSGSAVLAADKPLVVVELFTSQGCSSCPPADALIEELAGRDDVLPLALHVDYWDYIGWTDSFASPAYTARQKAYARVAGKSTIYTPQMVVEGQDHVVGFRPMQVADLIQARREAGESVTLSAEDRDGALYLSGSAVAGATISGKVNIDLVSFIPSAKVDILHGENAGSTITYANIVQNWTRLGVWNGQGDFTLTAPLPEEGPLAVIVQENGPGHILAALRIR
jgi:hypothetical protein